MRPLRPGWTVGALVVAIVAAGCESDRLPADTSGGTESLPFPASMWLTSRPASPVSAVDVELGSPRDPDFHRRHTFAAGEVLRGSIPLSSGPYWLSALNGMCRTDVLLGPSREVDVVLRLPADGRCSFELAAEHGEEVEHREPSVLVAPAP